VWSGSTACVFYCFNTPHHHCMDHTTVCVDRCCGRRCFTACVFYFSILHTITAWITRLFVWIDAVWSGSTACVFYCFNTPHHHCMDHTTVCVGRCCGRRCFTACVFYFSILHTITAWITRLFVWIDAVAASASLPAYFIILIPHTITAWITRLFVWIDAVNAGAGGL